MCSWQEWLILVTRMSGRGWCWQDIPWVLWDGMISADLFCWGRVCWFNWKFHTNRIWCNCTTVYGTALSRFHLFTAILEASIKAWILFIAEWDISQLFTFQIPVNSISNFRRILFSNISPSELHCCRRVPEVSKSQDTGDSPGLRLLGPM